MKIGISSYTYTWAVGVKDFLPSNPLTVKDLFYKAESLNVNLVQFCDNLSLDFFSDSELDELYHIAEKKGISIQIGTKGIDSENLLRYLHIAKKLKSNLVRTLTDTDTYKPDVQEIIKLLKKIEPYYRESNISLAIENHDRLKTLELVSVIRGVNSPAVGICLDTVNSFGSLEGPEVVIDRLLPYTINVHVKDFIIFRESHKMGFRIEGRPAGEGMLDIPLLVKNIKQLNKDLDLILELWTPFQNNLEETIKLEENWAKKSILYLRGVI